MKLQGNIALYNIILLYKNTHISHKEKKLSVCTPQSSDKQNRMDDLWSAFLYMLKVRLIKICANFGHRIYIRIRFFSKTRSENEVCLIQLQVTILPLN